MPEAAKVRVKGLRQLHSALKRYESDLKDELEDKLADAGRIVESSATAKFLGIDPTEPSGFTVDTRGFGRVRVKGKRSMKRRGDFGSLLMKRALLPALAEERPRVILAVEHMLNTIGRDNGF